jgi:hypothetical protein
MVIINSIYKLITWLSSHVLVEQLSSSSENRKVKMICDGIKMKTL